MSVNDEIHQVISNPATSCWLRESLEAAIKRDPVDAANEVEVMADLLGRRAQQALNDAIAVMKAHNGKT
jgi:hypothetical protein